jgi:Lon protease-like protein
MDQKVFLFPLNNSVLFKKVPQPFHIFEPRYRQMVKDALTSKIPIAIVSHRPSDNYQGQICVAGPPHILQTYPDGRMDIYITGTLKCRLTDFQKEDPYKIYSFNPLEEEISVDDSLALELESLKALLNNWAMHVMPESLQQEAFLSTLEDPELLVNYCTVFLVDDYQVKRSVMESKSLREKIQILISVIGPKEISLGPFLPKLKF